MRQPARTAFTLIELLIVIGIIAVLIAIGLTVAPALINSGRAQATQSTLVAMESVVQELSTSADLRPKDYQVYVAVSGNESINLPIIDGRLDSAGFDRDADRAEPSFARLLKVVEETVPGIESRWTQLDPSIVAARDITGEAVGGTIGSFRVSGTEVLDNWGNPIRFVHPSFDGGGGNWYANDGPPPNSRPAIMNVPYGAAGGDEDFRRSFRPFDPTASSDATNPIGDADEGIVPGGSSGYLYSAGPDGDPGTRGDNVYASVIPEYPSETRDED
ncbi:MAG: prepilin-type N-terminal cleavage/methylation domain-containing protein [Planctomycetota bacterium]